MANFNTHLITAAAVSGFSATVLYGVGVVSETNAVLNFGLGTACGLLPDLDSDNSVILKIMFSVLAVIISFFTVFILSDKLYIAEMVIIWLTAFSLIYFLGYNLFKQFTRHRGVFHSIPAAVVVTFLIILLLYSFTFTTPMNAWVSGLFAGMGYLTHLILDEIYSVDLSNTRIKKSFGTAFKLWDNNNYPGTAILYFCIFVFFLSTPSFEDLIVIFTDENFLDSVKDRVLPKDGWFLNLR